MYCALNSMKLLRTALVVLLTLVALYALIVAALGSASWGVFSGAVMVLLVSVAGLVVLRRRSAAAAD